MICPKIGEKVYALYSGIFGNKIHFSVVCGIVKKINPNSVVVNVTEQDEFFNKKLGDEYFNSSELGKTFEEVNEMKMKIVNGYYDDKIKTKELLIECKEREIKELREEISSYKKKRDNAVRSSVSCLYK